MKYLTKREFLLGSFFFLTNGCIGGKDLQIIKKHKISIDNFNPLAKFENYLNSLSLFEEYLEIRFKTYSENFNSLITNLNTIEIKREFHIIIEDKDNFIQNLNKINIFDDLITKLLALIKSRHEDIKKFPLGNDILRRIEINLEEALPTFIKFKFYFFSIFYRYCFKDILYQILFVENEKNKDHNDLIEIQDSLKAYKNNLDEMNSLFINFKIDQAKKEILDNLSFLETDLGNSISEKSTKDRYLKIILNSREKTEHIFDNFNEDYSFLSEIFQTISKYLKNLN